MNALTRLYHEHPKTILFTAAGLLRLLLAIIFPALPDLLSLRAEIASPVNGFKRLQEGLFLYDRGLDPYDGGIFHQAPLLLPLFSLVPSPTTTIGRAVSVLLYTLLDVVIADNLFFIGRSGAAATSFLYSSPRRDRAWASSCIAAIYLFNPFTLVTCLGRPTTVFTALFTLLSVRHACEGKPATTAFALAVAAYLSLHPLLLLPPVGLLCYDQLCQSRITTGERDSPNGKRAAVSAPDQTGLPSGLVFGIEFTALFALFAGLLLALSRLLLPSWQFLPSVYLTPLTLPDLTPNPGLWWYFFVEMFDAFREFFLGVFWLHMLAYSIPFCVRLRRQPLAAVVCMMGIIVVFQPYANVGDAGVWLASSCLFGHVTEISSTHRYTFPALATLLYATLLGPAFHYLWIYAGSGNANFFYAITLVWNLALLVLLTDLVYAVLRDEWEAERPEGKGKEIRQI